MVICSLDALKKSLKKKETRIKKEIVEVLQKPSYRQKQRPELFCKIGVLRNFTKFTRKHLCQSLFFNKTRLWQRGFPMNFAKFLKTTFFIDYLWRLTSVPLKENRKLKDRNDEILDFDLVFVGYSSSDTIACFQKVNFPGFNLVI